MEKHYQQDRLTLSRLLNRLLLMGFLAMTLVSVGLGAGLVWALHTQPRTLVPPSISQAFTVSGSEVDGAYLSMMGEYFLFLKLNVTPANVSRQYGRLLEYVPPETWAILQPALVNEAKRIQASHIASRFDPLPGRTTVSVATTQMTQTGRLVKSVGNRTLPEDTATYRVSMDYRHGELVLLGIHRIKETTP